MLVKLFLAAPKAIKNNQLSPFAKMEFNYDTACLCSPNKQHEAPYTRHQHFKQSISQGRVVQKKYRLVFVFRRRRIFYLYIVRGTNPGNFLELF